jgi:hypothetical protein
MSQTIFAMRGEGKWGWQRYTSANVPTASNWENIQRENCIDE